MGGPDQIYQAFANHGPAIQAVLLTGTNELFAGLAVIELVWIIGWSVAHKTDIIDMMIVVARFAISIGFWFWMMQNWVQMAAAITNTFGIWGNSAVVAAGGTANMFPMDFINSGLDLWAACWKAMSWHEPITATALFFAAAVDLLIFGWIAAQIMFVVIEAFLASYLGTVLMAFNASGFTRDFGSSPIRYAISVGMKRMTLQFIAGIAQVIVQGWATSIQTSGAPTWTSLGVMVVMPLILVILADRAPKIAQDMIIGTHLSSSAGIAQSTRQIASAAAQIGSAALAMAGVGKAVGSAASLAARQTAGTASWGISRAATMASLTAQNVASGYASDVGQRLRGNYQNAHGSRGWRVSDALDKRQS